ncbi:hypothetical protein MJM41_21935, partial [Salmonella enterica subsp. enterica serovar Montevideo]|nr:hypothetical protein [Salmonella enterica subsp. enterica serovar Montevideo]
YCDNGYPSPRHNAISVQSYWLLMEWKMISSWFYRKLLKKSESEGFATFFISMVKEVETEYPYAQMHVNIFVLYRLFKKARDQKLCQPSWSNDHH